MKVKALSVRQPWAQMIAGGVKTIEVRSWATPYRGELLICASKRPAIPGLPIGVAVARVYLVDCRPMTPADEEPSGGVDCEPGLWAWVLAHAAPVADPWAVRGKLGLFEVEVCQGPFGDELSTRAAFPCRACGYLAPVFTVRPAGEDRTGAIRRVWYGHNPARL